jgi:NADPH:quinone reductase-like Zn-dependent oxidoreductase
MARVVRFHKTGGPEVLQVEEVAVPPPGKGEVQISVKDEFFTRKGKRGMDR